MVITTHLGFAYSQSVNTAEMIAFLSVLIEASSLNIHQIIVLDDSSCAIQWARGECQIPWSLADIAEEVI